MPRPQIRLLSFLFASTMLLVAQFDAKGAETITRRGSKNVSGDVTEVTRTDVTIKVKTPKEETISVPANDIVSIAWTGEAPEAAVARSDDNAGRLSKALEGYQKSIASSKSTNPAAKGDLEFGIARVTAKQALADPKEIDAAIKLLDEFRTREHYRHFEAVQLLGELYLAKQDFIRATTAFENYGKAPWKDAKLRSKVQLARLKVADGKFDDAISLYDTVLADPADGATETALKQEAQLGKARVLIVQQKPADALKMLDEVIQAADGDEVALNAEAFLRKGDCLRELGKEKDAVLDYLRVDLIFSSARPQHAEALYQLSKLWGKVGHPERAEDARDRLTENYPNSEWTARLKGSAG